MVCHLHCRQYILYIEADITLGFKFLPTLGKYVVKVLENSGDGFTGMWKWKTPSVEETEKFQESMIDPRRRLDKQEMASISDLIWS